MYEMQKLEKTKKKRQSEAIKKKVRMFGLKIEHLFETKKKTYEQTNKRMNTKMNE